MRDINIINPSNTHNMRNNYERICQQLSLEQQQPITTATSHKYLHIKSRNLTCLVNNYKPDIFRRNI